MDGIRWASLIMAIVAALPANAFPVLYLRSAWRSNPLGKALMFQGASVAVIMDYVCFRLALPDFPSFTWIGPIIYGLIGLMQLWLVILLYREQNSKDDPTDPYGRRKEDFVRKDT